MLMEQKIKAAAAYKGISQARLAKMLGMTASNFNQKLKRGTFKDEELEAIAAAVGARYIPFCFSFDGGVTV